MPPVDEDLSKMFLAIDGVEEGRLSLAEAVVEINAICHSRPTRPYGEDDYLQIRKGIELPIPSDDEGTKAHCEVLRGEIALINLHREYARGRL